MLKPNLILSHMEKLNFFKDFIPEEKRKINHAESYLIWACPIKSSSNRENRI